MEIATELERRIAGIAALDQPVRRDLYRLLSHADGWLSRDDASDALGIGRPVAAFHLDKLVEAGVLQARFERLTGRTGPGAGRPTKLYRPVHDAVSASIPARQYDLAAELLAEAVAEATRTETPAADRLQEAARAAGHRIGVEARERSERGQPVFDRSARVVAVLDEQGYEPTLTEGGEITLDNCPFHRLAEQHRPLVCGMNLDFLSGLLDGLGPADRFTPRLHPEPGHCCVRVGTS